MRIREIEAREHDFVVQLDKLLTASFVDIPIDFKIHYFKGETSDGDKGLYFAITTQISGTIYDKFKKVDPGVFLSDIEDEFIQEIVNELFLSGVTFLHVEKIRYNSIRKNSEDFYSKMMKVYPN
jgi:hypothetical protein